MVSAAGVDSTSSAIAPPDVAMYQWPRCPEWSPALWPAGVGEHISRRVLSNPPAATITLSAAIENSPPALVRQVIPVAREPSSDMSTRTHVLSVRVCRGRQLAEEVPVLPAEIRRQRPTFE